MKTTGRTSFPLILILSLAMLYAGCEKNPVVVEEPKRPNAPTELKVIRKGEYYADLSWKDNSSDESGFEIERKTPTAVITNRTQSNVNEYRDTSLERGKPYTWRVRAYKNTSSALLYSNWSNEASDTTLVIPLRKPMLNNPQAISPMRVDLSWTDSDEEKEYVVLRGTSRSSLEVIATKAQNETTHTDSSGVRPSTDYWYAVVARDTALGKSTSSDTLSTKTHGVRIKVSGRFYDIMTNQPIQGATVRLVYDTARDSMETITDGSGNYFFDVPLIKSDQHDFAVRALGGSRFYNFMEKFKETYPKYTDIKLDPFSFERMTIQENPLPGYEYLKDMLEFIIFSHVARHPKFPDILYIHRWRDEDITKNIYYQGRMDSSSIAEADRGIALMEEKLKLKLYRKVSSNPEVGIIVNFGDRPGPAPLKLAFDNDGNVLYPLKWEIGLYTNSDGSPRFNKNFFTHQALYIENTVPVSSPFESHSRFGWPYGPAGIGNPISDTEALAINILYKLPLTKDRKYLLYR